MHPNVRQAPRRVHSADFKAEVMAQCREPGASVAAVAMAHGVNANVVRKWLAGRGLKRAARVMQGGTPIPAPDAGGGDVSSRSLPGAMRFVPVGITPATISQAAGVAPGTSATIGAEAQAIRVELRCGAASVLVQWPTSQAQGCVAWLSALAGTVLKG
ncbi:MAG TPA: transposase [Ramlibacter sp.]|nr:transposase [Ramlibacter sp.]